MALAAQPASEGITTGHEGGVSAPTNAIFAGDGPIQIPDASQLFNAEFVRSGNDLTLVGDDGSELLIVNYFGAGAPDLMAPNHAMLDGQTVTLLAGPQFPGQYAQAGGATQSAEAIGKVEVLTGNVTVQHADGTSQPLKPGDPVFESDVVSTGPGASIGMKLADGTLLSLQESGKLAINEFVYSDGGADNSALVNVIQGTFSLFAGQVAPTGDMKIQTPIATMGIRGTSILGVDVNAILGRLSLTQDPDGHVGFIEIFNNANGNLFTVLRTVFEKITVSESGLLSLTPKTPEELSIDQTLTELLHNFHSQVPQQGPDETPRPQSGQNRFEQPNIQEINFDNTPPPPDSPELLLPEQLLEQFIESLLQVPEIRDEIILALSDAPSAGSVILDDQLEGEDGEVGSPEGGEPVDTTLPFDFGTSGPGSVGFAALDGQPILDANGEPVTNGNQPLTYVWDASENTLTAVVRGGEGEEDIPVFTVEVNPTTGAVSVTIIGAVDHLGENSENLSIDIPFTVQAANGATATGTLTVGISDDVPVAMGDSAEVSGGEVAGSNIIILMDTSGSMNANAGEQTRFELAKSAALNLLAAAGIGQALVIDFANGVGDSNWGSAQAAENYINGLQAGGGGTNLDSALERVLAEYGNAGPAEKTYIYVMSDGGASTGFFGIGGDYVGPVEEIIWKLWLAANGVDGVFTYDVGGNADWQLEAVGWNPSDPFNQQNPQELADAGQLLDHYNDLIGYTPPTAEGNVLANDDLGADGLGAITSIVIDGVTYQYDPESGSVITLPGNGEQNEGQYDLVALDGLPPQGSSITIDTQQGGEFTFHFADDAEGGHSAGDWQYVASGLGENTLPYEHIRYTVTDGDGDQVTSDLVIEIEPDVIQGVAIGGEGDDTLTGVAGDTEVLVGGLGADKFVLNSFEVSDFIADYNQDEGDVIDLSALLDGYNQANETSLSGEDFLESHVSYNSESGEVSVDSSVVATLGNTPADVTIVVDDTPQAPAV